jgi:hypothetical protein
MSQPAKNKIKISEKIGCIKVQLVNEILPGIIRYLSKYLMKMNRQDGFNNPDEFEDFGPIVLEGKEDKYSEKIKYSIDNPSILNLAVTGPLGSGKSTILRTFEYKYGYYRFLNISLATFDKKTLDTDKIEHNILKQLFYSVEHKKIPESRFKRIENLKRIKLKTFLFILWLCSLLYLLQVKFLDVLKEILYLNYYSGFMSFAYALYFTGYSCTLIYMVMHFLLNFKLTKFKIKDVDFDNEQDKKTVNFENEIDEILYFFERNPVEIVFFQDLDRFNESEIFIKLREINSLINNYEPIKKQRKITFIYAVCDDIFKENERAKFFDFIIPVIPVINYTSSSSKLLSKLNADVGKKKLSIDFIDDVSLFLNDYRTIKSIYNEYQIYKSIIGGQLESYNNLLAMMIYKNIEPSDFDMLNLHQGYVYSILINSKELTKESSQKLKDKTSILNANIAEAETEKLKDVKELRMIYILKFVELTMARKSTAVYGFYLNKNRLTFEQIITDDFFDLFRKENNIMYYYNEYSNQGSSISFAELDKQVNRVKYAERLQIVLNKQAENFNIMKSNLQEVENKEKELISKKMYEILDSENSAAYFEKYKENNMQINNFKLINYLLQGGYINEDYNHYISYFHPGSITKEDNDFLLSLLPNEKPLPYTHKLKELSNLVKRIKQENFSNQAILNLSLVDYLIENKKTVVLAQITDVLIKVNPKVMSFIDDYLNHAKEPNRAVFLQILAGKWPGMWIYIITKSNFSSQKIETYFQYIFSYLEQKAIAHLNMLGSISKFIAELEKLSFIYKSEGIKNSVKEFVLKSDIKFKNLVYDEDSRDLFDFIYSNNLYALNEWMIEFFIFNFNANETDKIKFQTANYTTIKNCGKIKLIGYIDKNLDAYIQNVFLKLDSNADESQENLCAILNNEDLLTRYDIIEKGKFSIADLSQIHSTTIQANLISYGKINISWKNMLVYYQKVKIFDQILIDYLNLPQNYSILSRQGLISASDETLKSNFAKVLINSTVSNDSFEKLTVNLPHSYSSAKDFGEISDSKIKSMIKFKRLLLTVVNYIFIKEKFNTLLIYLVEVNSAQFVKDFQNYTIESSLILEILSSQIISSQQKLVVIENSSDEILTGNKSVLVQLAAFLSINQINKISFALLNNLIANAVSNSQKVQLTNLYFAIIEDSNLKTIIEKVEGFSKLLSGKRPKVDNVLINSQLIRNLEGKLISKAKILKDNQKIELFPYTHPRI